MAGKNSQNSRQKNAAAEKNTKSKKTGSNAAKKTTSSKKAASGASKAVENEDEVSFSSEIMAWVIGACMLILELANFELCGAVAYVSRFFFGIFGAIQYIIPAAIMFAVFFLHINEYKKRAIQKVVFGFIVLICIGMITQMALGITDEYHIDELFKLGFGENLEGGKIGGGVVCGTLAFILNKLVGAVGTYIIIILSIIICVVLVAEVSLIDALRNLFGDLFFDDDEEYDENNYNDDEISENKRRVNKKKKSKLDPEFQQIIIEDYSDSLGNGENINGDGLLTPPSGNTKNKSAKRTNKKAEKKLSAESEKKGNILGSIEVLPAGSDNQPVNIDSRSNVKRPDGEDVHEIVMDIPVNLPGENMDIFQVGAENVSSVNSNIPISGTGISNSTNDAMNESIASNSNYNAYEDAAALDLKTQIANLTSSYPSSIKPQNDGNSEKVKRKKSSSASGTKQSKIDNASNSSQGDTLTESEKEAIMTMENKTAKAEKNMSAKEVGNSDSEYHFPPLELLQRAKSSGAVREETIRENAVKLQEVLKSFGVNVTMTNCSCGPSVTRYEMVPEQGVKVSKITGLADDIMMNLAAQSIRIEAPIPGKSAVGIEIPNGERTGVGFRELIDTEKFIKHPSKIAFAVGKDIEGNVVVEDIAKMPHLLIAGATGSGKSVCTNTLIMSILYKARPDEVKLILVDPKQVELKVYNGIPHLLTPVVTDPKKAAGALNWAVAEMTKRYQMFSECNVRNIQGYNEKVKEVKASGDIEESSLEKMPQIVIIVDELADLMMVAKAEVEEAIVRLAQLARAAGIHLVIATQRPSVDVVTGLIKANVPSRIALSVSSGIDSRTIIDTVGAEKLLGNGDMLFYPTMYPKPLRVQGAYISDDEVVNVVEYLKANNGETTYSEEMTNQITSSGGAANGSLTGDGGSASDKDDYFIQAGKFIIEKNKASIGMLQRMFKIGFNRAARIMDQLCEAGVVGPEVGTKPREVLMTEEQFEEYVDEYF